MPSIVITGCSSGIGYETAKFLYLMGWQVFACCRKAEDAERLRQEGLHHALVMDVCDSDSIAQAFADVQAATGGTLDALFSNAGYGQTGAVEDINREALRQQYETNVFGAWECVCHAMKIFRRQGYGRILVNSSILGFAAMPFRGAYNSSKFALEGMCDTLRHEVRGSRIFVSLVEPGPVATRFRPNALAKFREFVDIDNSFHREFYQYQLNRLAKQGNAAPFTVSAQACAAVCVKVLTANRPKARYLVTVPTIVYWYLKRILPTVVFDMILNKSVGKQGKRP